MTNNFFRDLQVIFSVIILSTGLSSCSSRPLKGEVPERSVASDFRPTFEQGLLKSTANILSEIRSPRFNSDTCATFLADFQRTVSKVDPTQISEAELEDDSLAVVEALWSIRLALHSKISEIPSKSCVDEIRSTLRLVRFVEDYLAERRLRIPPVNPADINFQNQMVPMLSRSPDYFLLRSPEFRRDQDFKTGDVLVTRGISFLSATISRIGDIDSQFSHVVFVYVDEKKQGVPTADKMDSNQNIYTMESYVGKGVSFYHLKYALKNENARILHLRPKDQNLARRSAQLMFEKAKKAIESGRPIPYDYDLNFNDHSSMSCAEVTQAAFEEASQGQFKIPYYPTTLSADDSFLKRFGMTAGETFTPGDLEVDPRFEIVAEWRDLRITRDSRIKDAILTQMLKWADVHGYELKDTFSTRMTGTVWDARRTFLWPLVKRLPGVIDFPKDLPKETLKSVALINEVGQIFLKYLKEKDKKQEAKTGWSMTYQNLYDAMDELRKKDLAVFNNPKTRKKALFHRAFGPKDSNQKKN